MTENKSYLLLFLVNLFFFCVFNPFISPFPIGTDVQLIVFLFAMVLFILAFLNNKLTLTKIELSFVIIAIWSLIYLGLDGSFNPRHRVGLGLALLIFLTLKLYWDYLNPKIIFASVLFNFFGVLFHFLAPSKFTPIAEIITRKIKVTEMSAARGASGFCPEPGLASALFAILLISVFYFKSKSEIKNSSFIVFSSICIISILLTKSATGLLLLIVIFGAIFLLKSNLKQKVLFLLVIFGIHMALSYLNVYENTRAGSLLVLVIENPFTFLLLDSSLAERAAGITFGLVGFSNWPLGYGGGAYANIAPGLDTEYGVMNIFATARDQTQETVSAFGVYLLEFGFIFAIFLILIFYQCFSFNEVGLSASILALFFILASFSITFPGTWFLLILSQQSKKNIIDQRSAS